MSEIMEYVKSRDPHEKEFHQAVGEVMDSVKPVLDRNPIYRKARIPERIVEPERVIMFRVPWVDDQGDDPGQPGFPDPDEQRDRAVQGGFCASTRR